MDEIGRRLAQQYPESNRGWGVSVQRWPRPIGGQFEQSLYLLFAAAVMVFLIGCVNLANLTFVRAVARSREQAIRVALGARRRDLLRQLVMESLILASAGGASGVAIAYLLVSTLAAIVQSVGFFKLIPTEATITMDASVVLFVGGMSLVSTLIFGLMPALASTARIGAGLIREKGSDVGSTKLHTRLRGSLVVAEVTLAFTLVTTAGLLVQSLFSLERGIAGGVDSAHILTAHLPISGTRFADRSAVNSYVDRLGDRIRSVPGVAEVAFAEGVAPAGSPFLRSFQIADRPPVDRARRPSVGFNTVSPSYFRAIGLDILGGRALAEYDREGAPPVVVINETFARTYFPGADAIGRRLLMDSRSPESAVKEVPWEIVGVVEDEGVSPWTRRPQPLMYATREQNTATYVMLVVRAIANPNALQDSIRKAVSAIEPSQAVADVRSMDRQIADYVVSDRLRSLLLSGFAAIAMTLATIGLYGLLSYVVVQRRREIGIRSALGASATALVAMVMREGMAITVAGVALGLVVSLLVSRLLGTMLFSVAPFDSATRVAVGVILVGTALGACYIPARRASHVDPLVALKHE
jgi:putative ABC transport system permease protein